MKNSKNERCGRLRRGSFALAPLAVAMLFLGCAGYQLGPTNGIPAGSRSLQVNLFQNQTWEPRVTEPIATALRRAIQRDGSYRLATRNDGDIVVDGVIVDFDRSGISFDPSDVVTVRDYELRLVALVKAVERNTGRVVLEEAVTGRTSIRTGPDLASAERQAMPLLAEDMARNITSLLVDGSW